MDRANRSVECALRRTLDLLIASLALLLLSPLLLSIAIAVKLHDGGPVLYRAQRIGQAAQPFRLLKFRTMVIDADKQGPGITARGDWRITPIGRWLRCTKLDELPQLWNVLAGHMSLVGPRPEDPRYVALYSPEQLRILEVRPGITSAASLAYRDEEQTLHGQDWETIYRTMVMPAKLAIDLDYIEHRSLRSDLGLMIRTIWTVARFVDTQSE